MDRSGRACHASDDCARDKNTVEVVLEWRTTPKIEFWLRTENSDRYRSFFMPIKSVTIDVTLRRQIFISALTKKICFFPWRSTKRWDFFPWTEVSSVNCTKKNLNFLTRRGGEERLRHLSPHISTIKMDHFSLWFPPFGRDEILPRLGKERNRKSKPQSCKICLPSFQHRRRSRRIDRDVRSRSII